MKSKFLLFAASLFVSSFLIAENNSCDPTDQCDMGFLCKSDLDNGWGTQNYLIIYQNSVSIDTVTLSGIQGFKNVSICDSTDVDIVYHSGSSIYDDYIKVSFNGAFDTIVSYDYQSGLKHGDTLYSFYYMCDPPTCPFPTMLDTSEVNANSVGLKWKAAYQEVYWDIQYGNTGFTIGEGTIIDSVEMTSHTVEELSGSSSYDFYVRANCGDEQSYWQGPLTVNTDCGVISTLPWTEDFESGIHCYTIVKSRTNIETWNLESNGFYLSGTTSLHIPYSDTYTQREYFKSPNIDLTSYSTIGFTFWFRMSYLFSTTNDVEDLYLFATNDDGITIDTLWHEEDMGTFNNFEWTEVNIDISKYSSSSTFQFWFFYTGLDGADTRIDDITISEDNFTVDVESTKSGTVNMYPNPASDIINIEKPDNALVYLIDIKGNTLSETSSSIIDVSELNNGMYFIQIIDEGNISTTKIQVVK